MLPCHNNRKKYRLLSLPLELMEQWTDHIFKSYSKVEICGKCLWLIGKSKGIVMIGEQQRRKSNVHLREILFHDDIWGENDLENV